MPPVWLQVGQVLPSLLCNWFSGMDCISKASDYVIQPFTQDEREQILLAYR
ncbi:hypothetical protein [Comamonas sp. C24C]